MRAAVVVDECELDDGAIGEDVGVGIYAIDGGVVDEVCGGGERRVESWDLQLLEASRDQVGEAYLLWSVGDVVECASVLILIVWSKVCVQGDSIYVSARREGELLLRRTGV